MTQEPPLWNTTKPPKHAEIPLARIKSLLKQDQMQQAVVEYCETTGAGLIESQQVVEEIKNGIGLNHAYRYIGWRTGGLVIFWCKKCEQAYKRNEIKKAMTDGDWGDYLSYSCKVCNTKTSEFHHEQANKAFNQLVDMLAMSGLRASETQIYNKGNMKATQDFNDEKFSPEMALEYEAALINGRAFLNFLEKHNYVPQKPLGNQTK